MIHVKGVLISESFSLWFKFKKSCQIILLSTIHLSTEKVLRVVIKPRRDLAPFWEDLTQSEKLLSLSHLYTN